MTIPSLQTLRAFEAAVRLQSYSAAGIEIGLTHSAVSRRIRELEQRAGTRLFERRGNQMIPTAAGRRLQADVSTAIAMLERIFPPPAVNASASQVRISVFPSLALRWLGPRLPRFRQRHPDVDCAIHISSDIVEIHGGGSGAIRYGQGDWPGVTSRLLRNERLVAVCTAATRDKFGLATAADLVRAPLLRHPWTSWTAWFAAHNLAPSTLSEGPEFSDSSLLLEAAEAGEGVALARALLVADALASGTLVRPVGGEMADAHAYYFVRGKGPAEPALTAFEEWIAAEMQAG